MVKIKFKSGSSSPFFQSLKSEISQLFALNNMLAKARRKLWIKAIFYFLLHISSYLVLFFIQPAGTGSLILTYIFIGLSGLLLGFNVSHDAMHGTFSRSKRVNHWLFHLSFNIQGNSAYLWKIRHNSSHHVFPNVDGCDADIDDNPFIRLSPQHPLRKYQRYQHIYSIFVYCFYTLHWFLIKDPLYLFKKKVANLQDKKHSLKQKLLFFAWKAAYLFLLLIAPILIDYDFGNILLCFLIMHVVNSLTFIHFLIATHFCMETQFPVQDNDGFLPYDYYTHQLATSLHYSPSSKFYNMLIGGFNAHAAHHLYPKLPHTVYPLISELIEKKAKSFNIPYNKLSLWNAINSHYRYLKKMGNLLEKINHLYNPYYIKQNHMLITTASSTFRSKLSNNNFFWMLAFLFFSYWIYGWFNCIDRKDWIIENLLVVILLSLMITSKKWHRLSDLSYLCIFLFVLLHLYGAFYAYTQNAFGSWLQTTFTLWRNPYDRIVHFSFGLFMAYPFREILINKFRVSVKASWLLPIEIAFSFGTLFELIEWGVSEVTTKATGETYVATQGDVWDAHKDIALAAAGAAVTIMITYIATRKNKSSF